MRVWFFAFIIAAVMVNGEKPKSHADQNKQEPTDAAQPLSDATGRTIIVVNQQQPQGEQEGHASNPPSYLCRLFSPENLPNIALVIVAAITALYVARQARETAKATKAMRDSLPLQKNAADAALLNAKAVINAERPWILVEYEWQKIEDLEGYLFFAVNKGKTPGEIVEAHFKPEILDNIPDKLALPPPSLNAPIFIPRRGDNLIVHNETWNLNPVPIHPESWINNEMKRDDVMNDTSFAYFFVDIVYRDLLRPKDDPEGIHHTRCCFVYDAFQKTIRPTGPSEYRHKD
jgi:hypothetical protein